MGQKLSVELFGAREKRMVLAPTARLKPGGGAVKTVNVSRLENEGKHQGNGTYTTGA